MVQLIVVQLIVVKIKQIKNYGYYNNPWFIL